MTTRYTYFYLLIITFSFFQTPASVVFSNSPQADALMASALLTDLMSAVTALGVTAQEMRAHKTNKQSARRKKRLLRLLKQKRTQLAALPDDQRGPDDALTSKLQKDIKRIVRMARKTKERSELGRARYVKAAFDSVADAGNPSMWGSKVPGTGVAASVAANFLAARAQHGQPVGRHIVPRLILSLLRIPAAIAALVSNTSPYGGRFGTNLLVLVPRLLRMAEEMLALRGTRHKKLRRAALLSRLASFVIVAADYRPTSLVHDYDQSYDEANDLRPQPQVAPPVPVFNPPAVPALPQPNPPRAGAQVGRYQAPAGHPVGRGGVPTALGRDQQRRDSFKVKMRGILTKIPEDNYVCDLLRSEELFDDGVKIRSPKQVISLPGRNIIMIPNDRGGFMTYQISPTDRGWIRPDPALTHKELKNIIYFKKTLDTENIKTDACPICYEDASVKTPVYIFSCGHIACAKCVDRSIASGQKDYCCLCPGKTIAYASKDYYRVTLTQDMVNAINSARQADGSGGGRGGGGGAGESKDGH